MSQFKFAMGAVVMAFTSAPLCERRKKEAEEPESDAVKASADDGDTFEVSNEAFISSDQVDKIEFGTVTGRTEYTQDEPRYEVRTRRYGVQEKVWYAESDICLAPDDVADL